MDQAGNTHGKLLLDALEVKLQEQFDAAKRDELDRMEQLHEQIMSLIAEAKTIHAAEAINTLVAKYVEKASMVLSVRKAETITEINKLQKFRNLKCEHYGQA